MIRCPRCADELQENAPSCEACGYQFPRKNVAPSTAMPAKPKPKTEKQGPRFVNKDFIEPYAVRSENPNIRAQDFTWLGAGLALAIAGWGWMKANPPKPPPAPPPPPAINVTQPLPEVRMNWNPGQTAQVAQPGQLGQPGMPPVRIETAPARPTRPVEPVVIPMMDPEPAPPPPGPSEVASYKREWRFTGRVRNVLTLQPVRGASLRFEDMASGKAFVAISKEDGRFSVKLPPSDAEGYLLRVESGEYKDRYVDGRAAGQSEAARRKAAETASRTMQGERLSAYENGKLTLDLLLIPTSFE